MSKPGTCARLNVPVIASNAPTAIATTARFVMCGMAFSLRPSPIAVNGFGTSPRGRCVQSKAIALCDSRSLRSNSYLDRTLLTFIYRRNRTVSAVGWSTVCFTFRLCSLGSRSKRVGQAHPVTALVATDGEPSLKLPKTVQITGLFGAFYGGVLL